MSDFLIAYLVCAAIFFPIDYVWLTYMGQRFYFPQLGDLLLKKPRFGIAGAFYLAYVAGIVLFAVLPASSVLNAALLGAALGFIAYGTYDLTNLSTMKGFTVAVAVVDIAWGSFLTALTAAGGYWLFTAITG
ncbi:DUF2177 family protein [Pelagibacterium lentulum]|uniref:Membrane protein n=1 Tax=Pelagibacterium lentulum TaxID=2029865 RepID=A0A916RAA0_9HYPH|nr:DUF2177 family protein [Pelagibacterium lentulum]GGA45289.1 membrane protein [Pelagibacterium lentulum]